MKENHPRELDLARLSDGQEGGDLAVHLRWCSSCRRILADYDWLQGELRATLDAKAAAAPIPEPDWSEVRGRISSPERQASGRCPLVAAGAALIACVMLVAPAVLGRGVQAQTPGAGTLVEAPAPVMAPRLEPDGGTSSSLTMTPVDHEPRASLPFVPPPTPPETEA